MRDRATLARTRHQSCESRGLQDGWSAPILEKKTERSTWKRGGEGEKGRGKEGKGKGRRHHQVYDLPLSPPVSSLTSPSIMSSPFAPERSTRLTFRVHHHLPAVDRQVGVVEAPVELFLSRRLIRRVVVRLKEGVGERLGRRDARPGVEDKHLLEQIDRCRRSLRELLRERDALALWQRLDEAERLTGVEESKISRSSGRERPSEERTFSEQMVLMTSSGGVPISSVMIENWLTSTIACDQRYVGQSTNVKGKSASCRAT